MTSLALDEFQQLVPPFEAAFQAHMAHWCLDGKPRTARRYTPYTNCPLPTPEDRLLFILVYLKTYSLQVVQGRLCGMGQSQAYQWMHVLLVVLGATLPSLGDAPTRSVAELARRLSVVEAEAAAMVEPTAGSRLLQGLGFLAFTLDQVETIMPMKKPRGRALTRVQKAANRRIARRRVRIEHVNSSVKRCRIVHDTCRLRKAGVRDLLMEVCCGLHNVRVRLKPWQPMV